MFVYQNGIVRTSVRQLVEFLLREGDIHNQGGLISDVEIMHEGSRIHRKIQKEQKITYQAEVPLRMEWQEEGYRLLLEGRADGIDQTDPMHFTESRQMTFDSLMAMQNVKQEDLSRTIYYIDEIKGLYQNVREFKDARSLHLAQAKCYAAMYLIQHELNLIGVQMTYCNLETEEIKRFHYIYEENELKEWFLSLIEQYRKWADYYVKARKLRQTSIGNIHFPFSYRDGQKKLIAMIYQSIINKQKVFFQAPTGIGKTISAIYPSLKTMAGEQADKIYYLTAKTITRTVAEDTLNLLARQGLQVKAVTLTAREKICCNEVCECNPLVCQYAKGHYDRINAALYKILTEEKLIDRQKILQYSEEFQVCPYQLSFEVETFSDFIICDYNYVFDPHVNRMSLKSENKLQKNILLIDEAHNLVERARDMYSAELAEDELSRVKKLLPPWEKRLIKKLANVRKVFKSYKKTFLEEAEADGKSHRKDYYIKMEEVDALYFPLFRFLDELLEYLNDQPTFEGRDELVDIFFRMRHFSGIQESMTEGYRIYGMWVGKGFVIRLFCIDPSAQIKDILDYHLASIFFSATLLPMPYYRKLLYGEQAEAYAIPSPFAEKNRLLCIAGDVTSRYSRRNAEEYQKIIYYIEKNIQAKKGNYMIFFPSYEMMEQTYALVANSQLEDHAKILLQKTMMGEQEKEEFLAEFKEDRDKSLLGFCVLGSIFSEGIDLSGNRLIGVLIVGTGLPKVCLERDMIRSYFDSHENKGYDYAYRFPGMNKVLQAAGRVIRSASDVGVITLMDERFLWKENQYLLPDDWKHYYEVNLANYSQTLEEFWKKKDGV